MAQLLAIEWDSREARIAIGRTRGKELTVEHTLAIPVAGREGDESSLASRLAEALQPYGVARVDTLIALGRTNLELRQLSLPPAPSDELPELVRFQALRQFATIGDDWPLDFVELAGTDAESINVLAAAVSPEMLRQINGTCESARLSPKCIVLRPFAAASLLRRHDAGVEAPCRLMVDLLSEEADLTVMDADRIVLTRSVRLATTEDHEVRMRGLLGEVRRTLASANSQLGGRRVEKVVLCGDGNEHGTFGSMIEKELSLAVEQFDPFSVVRLGPALRSKRPENSGRFAPLLGLLLDEATSTRHAIDFLHPRKKPEPVDRKRRNILIAATLGTMALAALMLVYIELQSLDDEIASLKSRSAAMKQELVAAEKTRKEAATVQEFLDHNISWLDEMYLLAEQLPPPDDVIVTQANFSVLPPNGGQIRIEGYTREPTQFQEVEERLRAANRAVASGTKANDMKREKLKYGFVEVIKVPTRDAVSSAPPSADSQASAGSPASDSKTRSSKSTDSKGSGNVRSPSDSPAT